jgi:hypothetical protein
MKLDEIRIRTAYDKNARPTAKEATRAFFNQICTRYPIALTLTFKQVLEIKTDFGVHYKKLDEDDIKRIVRHFQHKLNKQAFGSSAKRYGKGFEYLVAIEGKISCKNLHVHMVIGNLPDHANIKDFDDMVKNAKLSVCELDKQHKVELAWDSGWMTEYLIKELSRKNTDNILWDLA